MSEVAPSSSPILYLVRRNQGGIGGAEKAAARMNLMLGRSWRIVPVGAGLPPLRLPGAKGPSWWRSLRFAQAASAWLRTAPRGLVLSLERGVDCDIYRAGDGVHARWVQLSGHSSRAWLNPLHWITPPLEVASVRTARVVVANSRMVADDLRAAYPWAAEKIRVIHNGVDRARYFPPAEASVEVPGVPRTGGNAPGFHLLLAGSGWERKGLATALQWLHHIRTLPAPRLACARLTVIGKGKPARYAALIKRLGLENAVVFAGAVDNPLEFYQLADAMLLPTLYDPFANTCLEALACGCPVITTPTNGAAEAIRDAATGLVVSTGEEPAHVALRIGDFLVNNRMTKAAISATIEHFTIEHETAAYQRLFHDLL